jgi:hypothetical protein
MPDRSEDYVLLDIGCAECRNSEPLIDSLRFFDTLAEAMAAVEAELGGSGARWRDQKEHPLGGVVYMHSSGDYWIAPVSVFTRDAEQPGGSSG